MCGIVAYIGSKNALPFLLKWLQRLEYRWYDSAGLCLFFGKGIPKIFKSVWRVDNLQNMIFDYDKVSNMWMAHTRRATHWKPTIENTHPHFDQNQSFFVVHNWIIENYHKIKQELLKQWYEFYSETDTEVIPALLSTNRNGDLMTTVYKILPMIHWAFALVIANRQNPKEFVAVKRWSPLVFWFNDDLEFFISSDSQALVWYAQNITVLKDWDIVHIKDNEYNIYSEKQKIFKTFDKLSLNVDEISKWDFPTFMMKEIYEQPAIVSRTFRWRVDFEKYNFFSHSFEDLEKINIRHIVFVACGTSYHAWQLWSLWINNLIWINTKVVIASEYINQKINMSSDVLHIFLSQSWETADTIEVLNYINTHWWNTFGIVNVVWSTIANSTDCGLFLRAWTEIWVASTKSFMSQITCLMIFTLYLWTRYNANHNDIVSISKDFEQVPNKLNQILQDVSNIKNIAKELSLYKSMFFLWRSYLYPIANESSLKLKEISYIHSESYPTWELKHGPLALIDENFPSILFCPTDSLFNSNMSNISEIKSRNWKIITISDQKIINSDYNIILPSIHNVLTPFLYVLVWQLLAYFIAEELWTDIDKPRNLAKSVTVK